MSTPDQFRVETGVPGFSADPHSPLQRGMNESTNGLLRQYYPKGTGLEDNSGKPPNPVRVTLCAGRGRSGSDRRPPTPSRSRPGLQPPPCPVPTAVA